VLAGLEQEKHNHKDETNCQRDYKHRGTVHFLLRGFIKSQRVPVYPVERVFLAEIRGKDDPLYAVKVTK